jgi:UDP-2,3-diacylglucosamine hydrolase
LAAAETDDTPRCIVFSDWHLPPDKTDKTDAFARFVDAVCSGARRVFILGDLFDAWVGPRHVRLPGHALALEALGRLTEAGIRVTVLRGNRDFLLDAATLRPYGLEFAGWTWRGELSGRPARLSHGDELTENDRLHKAAKAVCSHVPVAPLVKLAPLALSGRLAGAYRWISARRRTRRKRRQLEPSRDRMRALFEGGTDLLVLGHWHRAERVTDAAGLPGKLLVRLGECTESVASYACIEGDAFRLETFPGP